MSDASLIYSFIIFFATTISLISVSTLHEKTNPNISFNYLKILSGKLSYKVKKFIINYPPPSLKQFFTDCKNYVEIN